MTGLNYKPNSSFVKAIVDGVNKQFKDKEMAAFFLAQVSHESGGIQYIEEVACTGKQCSQYGTGAPGKSYHGRGFIQLTGPDNYKKASQSINKNDSLYTNPEKVLTPSVGMDVSVWFWNANVANKPGVSDKSKFGAATKAINGALECTGSNVDQSKNRYKIYTALCKEMNISKPASESGCYN